LNGSRIALNILSNKILMFPGVCLTLSLYALAPTGDGFDSNLASKESEIVDPYPDDSLSECTLE